MRILVATTLAAALVSSAAAASGFATRANAICEGYYKKLNKIPPPGRTAPSVGNYIKKVTPLSEAEYARFKAMKPPASVKATYAQWLAITRKELALSPKIIAAGHENDATAVNKLITQAQQDDKQYDALANKMGMTVCGQPNSNTR